MTSKHLASQIAELKSEIENLQLLHAKALVHSIAQGAAIIALGRCVRQQGAKFDQADIAAAAREMLLSLGESMPIEAEAIAAELAKMKFLATDDLAQ